MALPYLKYPSPCIAIGCYVSYSLFMWVGLCITLMVLYIRFKVIVIRITLHWQKLPNGISSKTQIFGHFLSKIA